MDYVDPDYYVQLAAMNPAEVCRRAACVHDAADNSYILQVWGDEYAVYPEEAKIVNRRMSADLPHPFFPLFIVYYLLRCEGINPREKWISEKDLPGGVTFFRGPHEIPTRLISDRFGNDLEEFARVCTHLSGTPVEMGDAAYRFEITSRIPAAVLLWQGDDELPPEAGIMYDPTIARHLTLDIVFALATEICTRIGKGG